MSHHEQAVRAPALGDAVLGDVLSDLLRESHLMEPAALPDHLAGAARPLGVSAARIYLADLQEERLWPMPDHSGGTQPALSIESTLAGRAFRTVTVQHSAIGHACGPPGERLWIPLVDGTERLGVLELCFDRPEGNGDDGLGAATLSGEELAKRAIDACRALASLAALVIVSKSAYSDVYAELRRSREMALQAEMVWAFMAPRTFATERVTLAAALEPAYEVGGDAFDHSLRGDRLHVSLFDSVGHDLTAGLISSVAMASCRTTRRSGGDLVDMALRADLAIADEFGASRFATALLCDLHLGTGRFTWLCCGHPPPLLVRDDKVIGPLACDPRPPLGLAGIDPGMHDRAGAPVRTERLQPGDRLLLYTDGVVEGRGPDGRQFGLARLGDFIIRLGASGLSAPETLRRLSRTILAYQSGRLADDATVLLVEWLPESPGQRLIA